MKLIFAEEVWDDYLHWQATDKTLFKRINRLIKETCRSPFSSTGKPEHLKQALSGYWSRRTNEEHRMVYKAAEDALLIAQLATTTADLSSSPSPQVMPPRASRPESYPG